MPVRNAGAYVVEAVDSILRQSESDFRLLVLDDGSDDDGLEALRAIADPRLEIHQDGLSLGVARRLNQGLDRAASPYVARMDADDVAEPDRLALQLAFLRSHPDVAICGGAYRMLEDGRLSAPIGLPESHEALRTMAVFASPLVHPTVMLDLAQWRRAALRYDEAMAHAEDYDLWERAADRVRLANLPQPLLRYRIHDGQVRIRHRTEQRLNADAVRRRALERRGISLNPAELELHGAYGHELLPEAPAQLRAMRDWLFELARRAEGRDEALAAECRERATALEPLLRRARRRGRWWRRWAGGVQRRLHGR